MTETETRPLPRWGWFDTHQMTVRESRRQIMREAFDRGWGDAEAAHLLDHPHDDGPGDCPDGHDCWVRASYGHEEYEIDAALEDVTFASNSANDFLNDLSDPGWWVGMEEDSGWYGYFPTDDVLDVMRWVERGLSYDDARKFAGVSEDDAPNEALNAARGWSS